MKNFAPDIKEEELMVIFKKFGDVTNIKLYPVDSDYKEYAYVRYRTPA